MCARTVCVRRLRLCTGAPGNMKQRCSFVRADVALTTSEAPETVQLLHTAPHLGRVC